MGGFGSGCRHHWWRGAKKTTVEDCLSIDASRLTRVGLLKAGVRSAGSWRWTYAGGGGFTVNYEVDTRNPEWAFLRLWYSFVWVATKEQESADYHVRLTATRPRFGGRRWWFACPLLVDGRDCGRRVGKLHLPPHGRHFGCRHCHDLTYTSCQESHKHDCTARWIARDTGLDAGTVKQLLKDAHRRQ
jgi:hypothetical protein